MIFALPHSSKRRLATVLTLAATLLPTLASAQLFVGWGSNIWSEQVYPPGLRAAKAITPSAYWHTLAIKTDGTVVGWGYQSGNGEGTPPAGLTNVVQVAGGQYFSLARRSNGTVVGWGLNSSGQANTPDSLVDAVDIAAGFYHGVAVRANGRVVGWGLNSSGQRTFPSTLTTAVKVAAGLQHTLVLKADGTVVGFGGNSSGQIDVPAGLNHVVQVAAGNYHSLALKSDGTVVGWGYNGDGEINIPAGLDNVKSISASSWGSVALKYDGTVVCWGYNSYGQSDVPAGLTDVVAVHAGESVTIAMRAPAIAKIDQSEIYAGYSATGTVTLAEPAPAGGATVGLLSDDPAVDVPASAFVPAGATSVTFPVTTDLVFGANHTAHIRTVFEDTPTIPAKVTLIANTATVTTSHTNVIAGSNTRVALTIELANPVLVDTYFVSNSDDPEVILDPTIRVRAGQKKAFIYATTRPVPNQRTATLAVSYLGQPLGSKALLLKILTATLTFDRYQLDGGDSVGGFVTLNANVGADTEVPLTAGPGVSVPPSLTVVAGTKSVGFTATTEYVLATTLVPVSANFNGGVNTKELRLAPKPIIQSITLQTYIFGRQIVTGKVRLKAAAPAGGAVVTLASSHAELVIPATVTIPEGAREATFTAEAADVPATVDAYVQASSGASVLTKEIEVRALTLSSLVLSTSSVTAGTSATGTVTLNVAVSLDTTVDISSQFPGIASVPVTVTIPAGSRTGTFTINTASPGATSKNVKITATKHDSTLYRTLKVLP